MRVLIDGSTTLHDAVAWRFALDPEVEVASVPGTVGTLRWGVNLGTDPESARKFFKPDLIVTTAEIGARGLTETSIPMIAGNFTEAWTSRLLQFIPGYSTRIDIVAQKIGEVIMGDLPKRWETKSALAFLEGLRISDDRVYVTGPHVACIIGWGMTPEEADASAADAAGKIDFDGIVRKSHASVSARPVV